MSNADKPYRLPNEIKTKIRRLNKLAIESNKLTHEIEAYLESLGMNIDYFRACGESPYDVEGQSSVLTEIDYGSTDVNADIKDIERLINYYIDKNKE